MGRFRRPLIAVYLAALFVAVTLSLHDPMGRWYTPAVAVFVASGLAITALVIRRGGTQ